MQNRFFAAWVCIRHPRHRVPVQVSQDQMSSMCKMCLALSFSRQKETAAFHTQQYTGLAKPWYMCLFKIWSNSKTTPLPPTKAFTPNIVQEDFNLRRAKGNNRTNTGTYSLVSYFSAAWHVSWSYKQYCQKKKDICSNKYYLVTSTNFQQPPRD